jgi:hypothetical protein
VARWRNPPRPAEPPAILRCFDPADWPDPVDWDDDAELVAECTRGWHALADPMGWWVSAELADYRAERRWNAARQQWADDHDVGLIEWRINDRLVPVRRGWQRG